MLVLEQLSASYDGSRILRGVTLEVPDRSIVCLMGRNGVGKTTTLKTLMGLVKSDSGRVRLGDRDLTGLPPEERSRAGLALVPQGREIFPHLTVRENLQISMAVHGGGDSSGLDRVFTLFPVLKEMLKRKGGVLSGGQQQQLAIARALLTQPRVLILDEPTEGIQPNIIDLIGDTLKAIRAEGRISILLVEQYLDFCREVGDTFHLMDRGAVMASGPMNQLGDELVRAYLTV